MPPDIQTVANAIKRRFGTLLRPEWLEKCLEYTDAELETLLLTENDNNGMLRSLETKVRLVFEQMLHSEINESCVPGLQLERGTKILKTWPPNPPGAFLQIQEIMDVGVSKNSLLEAVCEKEDYEQRGIRPSYIPSEDNDDDDDGDDGEKETHTEPGERKPKVPRKMLKLTLTDGCIRIKAIELVPIPQLNAELSIGTKVLVKGGRILKPIGVLCLHPADIQVLGGSPEQYNQQTLKTRLRRYLQVENR